MVQRGQTMQDTITKYPFHPKAFCESLSMKVHLSSLICCSICGIQRKKVKYAFDVHVQMPDILSTQGGLPFFQKLNTAPDNQPLHHHLRFKALKLTVALAFKLWVTSLRSFNRNGSCEGKRKKSEMWILCLSYTRQHGEDPCSVCRKRRPRSPDAVTNKIIG
ncbi:uncharacterized protein LOC115339973 isoform X2 [Aquila chrysaetos chrysaetos]|nr:uncharacterized protein LOC115339973 isoform X2 [Aquila chrysaetos chrysaetos]